MSFRAVSSLIVYLLIAEADNGSAFNPFKASFNKSPQRTHATHYSDLLLNRPPFTRFSFPAVQAGCGKARGHVTSRPERISGSIFRAPFPACSIRSILRLSTKPPRPRLLPEGDVHRPPRRPPFKCPIDFIRGKRSRKVVWRCSCRSEGLGDSALGSGERREAVRCARIVSSLFGFFFSV